MAKKDRQKTEKHKNQNQNKKKSIKPEKENTKTRKRSTASWRVSKNIWDGDGTEINSGRHAMMMMMCEVFSLSSAFCGLKFSLDL